MIKVGIIGATGYAGNEIVRLLLGHKDVKIVCFVCVRPFRILAKISEGAFAQISF